MSLEPIPHGWQTAALCRGKTDLFFPPDTDDEGDVELDDDDGEAAELCRSGCPVRITCLEVALDLGRETSGVWGGFGTSRRIHLRQARSRQIAEGYEPHRFTPGCSCSFCSLADSYNRGTVIDRNTPGARHGFRASYGRGCRCPACQYRVSYEDRLSRVIAA